MAQIRDAKRACPEDVVHGLLDLLRNNDNSHNMVSWWLMVRNYKGRELTLLASFFRSQFSDSYYIGLLLENIAFAMDPGPNANVYVGLTFQGLLEPLTFFSCFSCF